MESVKKLRLGDKAIPIIIALVAVVIVGIAAAVIHKKQDKVETQRTARVVEVNGPCSILREGATINAIADMPIYSGDTFFSGVNASARIMVDDDKFLYLDAATRINFTASGTPDDTHTMIYVETGSLLTEVKEKLAEGETFDIVTPNTCTAIHGTIPMVTVAKNWEGKTTTTIGFAEGEGEITVFERAASGAIRSTNLNMGAHEGASFTTEESATLTAQDAQSLSETGKTAGGKSAENTTLDDLQTVSGEAVFESSFLDNSQAATQRNTQDYVNNNNLDSGSAVYQQENLATVQANEIIDEFRSGEAMLPVTVVLASSSPEPVADAAPQASTQPATEPSQEPATLPSQDPSPVPDPVPAPSAAPAPVTTANNIIYVNGVPLTVEEQIQAIEAAQREVQAILAQQAAEQQAAQPSESQAPASNEDTKPAEQPASNPEPEPQETPAATPSVTPATTPASTPDASPSTAETPQESPADTPSPSSSSATTPQTSPSEETTSIHDEEDDRPSPVYVGRPISANGPDMPDLSDLFNPSPSTSTGPAQDPSPAPERVGCDVDTEEIIYRSGSGYYTRNDDGHYEQWYGYYYPDNP